MVEIHITREQLMEDLAAAHRRIAELQERNRLLEDECASARTPGTDQVLQGNQLVMEDILDIIPDGVIISDQEHTVLDVNTSFCRITGQPRSEFIGRSAGTLARKFLSGSDLGACLDVLRQVSAGGQVQPLVLRYGDRWLEITSSYSSRNRRSVGILRDITDTKENEEALKRRNTFIQTILDNLPIGVALNEMDQGVTTYTNRKLEEIYGWPFSEIGTVSTFFERVYPDPEYRKEIMDRVMADIASGDPTRMHWEGIRTTRMDGSHTIVNAVNIPLPEQNVMVSTVMDVTTETQIREELRAMLHEKELLLREVHHRVKNNLQIISSLLDLQADCLSDPALVEILNMSRKRIRAMALIHEELHSSMYHGTIQASNYIMNLTHYLASMSLPLQSCSGIRTDVEDVGLPIDTAIPLGLIITELVTNAIKYAFPQERRNRHPSEEKTNDRPCIRVSLRVLETMGGEMEGSEVEQCPEAAGRGDANHRFALEVSDNGIGLPADFDVNTADSLGLQLVSMLTQQLNGSMAIETNPGTNFRITFCPRRTSDQQSSSKT